MVYQIKNTAVIHLGLIPGIEYQRGNNLCKLNYDMRQQNFDGKTIKRASTRRDGDCPALPIGKTGDTKSILNRCIPTILGDAADSLTDFVSSIPTVNKVFLIIRSRSQLKS